MAKHLFITGAGASVGSGGPVMSNFLDHASDLLASGSIKREIEQIHDLFEFRRKLRQVYANSNLDLHNIESLLSAIEMGVTIGGIANYDAEH